MIDREVTQFVRPLKGAAASIMVALLVSGRNMTALELRHVTGYSDKPVASGLAMLEALGAVQFHGRQFGYALTRQYALPYRTALPGPGMTDEKAAESRKLSDFPPSSSSSYDPLVISGNGGEEEERAEIFRLLCLAGVGKKSPKMRSLLGLGLSVDYVSCWVGEFLAHRAGLVNDWDRFTVGTLIHILECGDPAPPPRCFDCLFVDCLCGVIRR